MASSYVSPFSNINAIGINPRDDLRQAIWDAGQGNLTSDQLRAVIAAQTAVQHNPPLPQGTIKMPKTFDTQNGKLVQMIMSRLRMTVVGDLPFDMLVAHEMSGGKVIVVVAKNGTHTTIEDSELFPSDDLITRLRLISQ